MKPMCRLWLVVAFAAVLPGCGPQVLRYPVEGVVTLDGKPVKGASVAFMPKAKGCPGIAATDADGRFALKELDRHKGVVPGEYQVVVFLAEYSKPKVRRVPNGPEVGGKPTEIIEIMASEPTIVRYIVPERYGRVDTSGLQYDVSGPLKEVPLALTTKQ
jgi:hypothetical protein